MRQDYQIALLCAATALPAGLAMSSAPEYIPFLKEHPGIVFWTSLIITFTFLALAATIAIKGERAEERAGGKRRMALLIGVIVGGTVLVGGVGVYMFAPPSLQTEFKQLEDKYVDRLGSIIDGSVVSIPNVASQAIYDNAEIIWLLDKTLAIYIPSGQLENDGSKKIIFARDQDNVDSGVWYPVGSDYSILRLKFGTPIDKIPPTGGPARRWAQDKKTYGWIGWKVWQTKYLSGTLSYQEFKNGIIIGPLRSSPNESFGFIYVIFYNGDRPIKQGTRISPAPYMQSN